LIRRRYRRLGLGPVFVYDWVTSARRWQPYALRSLFLLIILLAVVMIYMNEASVAYYRALARLAYLSEQFYVVLAGTMLAIVLLAAPAATAGAICLDRARGTLLHMLVTDLSDAEIVLGKLAARLVPVLALIACMLPVLELVTLTAGVDPEAVLGLFVVAVGVAVLGCSLALVLSLWVGKTHQALLLTYAVWGVCLLLRPISDLLASIPGWPYRSSPKTADPLYLAFAPYWWPGTVTGRDYLWFLGGACAISGILTGVAVLRLRSVCIGERAKKTRAPGTAPAGSLWRLLTRNVPWLTPSLDRNPVAWREWHRGRLSRWGAVVACLYVGSSFLASLLAILWQEPLVGFFVNGLQVSIGLLLLSVTAATSLAEERASGSLDILLSTPLSSRQIVLGKWLGAYRVVPLLAILPWMVIAVNCYIHDRSSQAASPMPLLIVVYILSAGAAITSLGLAMATWVSRLARAVGMTVALYVIVTAGAATMTIMQLGPHGEGLAMASPFDWVGTMTLAELTPKYHVYGFNLDEWAPFWTVVSAGVGIGLLLWIMTGFERHLGRVADRISRISYPSPPVRVATTIYVGVAAICSVIASIGVQSWDWILFLMPIFFAVGKVLLSLRAARSLDEELLPGGEAHRSSSKIPAFKLVMARWLGASRIIAAMVLFPALMILCRRRPSFLLQPQFVVLITFLLLQSAAVASFGAAMATWFRRRGRAVLATLLFWTLWEILGLVSAAWHAESPPPLVSYMSTQHAISKMSFDIALASETVDEEVLSSVSKWTAGYGVAALAFLIAAIATFDRSIGRAAAGPPASMNAGWRGSRRFADPVVNQE